MVKNFEGVVRPTSFDKMHARDGQTDGQTDTA